jgi:hypothetical protein
MAFLYPDSGAATHSVSGAAFSGSQSGMLETPSLPGSDRQDRIIQALVGLALDDLEYGHLDVETALRFVANRAWGEGHREGANHTGDLAELSDRSAADPA